MKNIIYCLMEPGSPPGLTKSSPLVITTPSFDAKSREVEE